MKVKMRNGMSGDVALFMMIAVVMGSMFMSMAYESGETQKAKVEFAKQGLQECKYFIEGSSNLQTSWMKECPTKKGNEYE